MINIIHVETEEEIEQTRRLFQEYAESLGFDLCFQNFDEEMRMLPGNYSPPNGSLLLARENNEIVGCVAMRPLSSSMCEMKRLYVRPRYRGKSIGRKLAEAVIAEARKCGYNCMRLDTVSLMKEANALYESLGFRQIPPYYHNPIPGTMYFELTLDTTPQKGANHSLHFI